MELSDLRFIASLSASFLILGIQDIFWPHVQYALIRI